MCKLEGLPECAELWELDVRFLASINGKHEDYARKRIERKLLPIAFKLQKAERIVNPTLVERQRAFLSKLRTAGRTEKELHVQWCFHGTHPSQVNAIAQYGLLRLA